jgi:hypothetical protein
MELGCCLVWPLASGSSRDRRARYGAEMTRLRIPAAVIAVLLVAGAGCSPAPTPVAATTPTVGGSPTASPGLQPRRPTTIVMVIMENGSYTDVVGNPGMPFLNHVLRPSSLNLTNMHANGHPSLPNYVWLTAGRSCGAGSDVAWGRRCRSVFDQLDAAGIGWKTYAEGYPGTASRCSRVSISDRVANDYARKHVPPLLFTSTSWGATCTRHVQNFPGDRVADRAPPTASFHDLGPPPFTIVVPNLCHDMHNSHRQCGRAGGGVGAADRWLRLNWKDLVADAGPRGAVILTWDESDAGDPPIPTFVGGTNLVGAGSTLGRRLDHASVLRAIEDALGLHCLARACSAHRLPIRVTG